MDEKTLKGAQNIALRAVRIERDHFMAGQNEASSYGLRLQGRPFKWM